MGSGGFPVETVWMASLAGGRDIRMNEHDMVPIVLCLDLESVDAL